MGLVAGRGEVAGLPSECSVMQRGKSETERVRIGQGLGGPRECKRGASQLDVWVCSWLGEMSRAGGSQVRHHQRG